MTAAHAGVSILTRFSLVRRACSYARAKSISVSRHRCIVAKTAHMAAQSMYRTNAVAKALLQSIGCARGSGFIAVRNSRITSERSASCSRVKLSRGSNEPRHECFNCTACRSQFTA